MSLSERRAPTKAPGQHHQTIITLEKFDATDDRHTVTDSVSVKLKSDGVWNARANVMEDHKPLSTEWIQNHRLREAIARRIYRWEFVLTIKTDRHELNRVNTFDERRH